MAEQSTPSEQSTHRAHNIVPGTRMALDTQDTEVGGDDHVVQLYEHAPEFDAERGAPRRARHMCVATLRAHGFANAIVQDAELTLSELATNAVVHAESPFSLAVTVQNSNLRIAVRDALAAEEDELVPQTGHGLGLIDTIATRWGVERVPGGKIVWAELST